MTSLRCFRASALAIAFLVGPTVDHAAAQAPPVFGMGLSFMTDDVTAPGFAANVTKDLTAGEIGIGPVGDFSLHTEDGATWMVLAGGVRVTGHPLDVPVEPFGQFLTGLSVFSEGDSETFLTFGFGGGVHVPLNDRLRFLLQFDVIAVKVDTGFGSRTDTGSRTTIGLSFPFGSD